MIKKRLCVQTPRGSNTQAHWSSDYVVMCPAQKTWNSKKNLLGFGPALNQSFLAMLPFLPFGITVCGLHHCTLEVGDLVSSVLQGVHG